MSPSERSDLGFHHRFVPASGPNESTLLLLHSTGGNEDDLIPIGQALAPRAALLSPRGKVLERGMPRFFRRLAPGVFDIDDLKARTSELADFVGEAVSAYHLDATRVLAVGYSNGANIAASLLLLRPGVLSGAILLRPMTPLVPAPLPDLADVPVLILAGQRDGIVSREDVDSLSTLLRDSGAAVETRWLSSGHELTQDDLALAKTWLANTIDRKQPS